MSEKCRTSKSITLKWISKYGALSVCYIAFIASAAIFTHKRIKFSGVLKWPSVSATILKSSSSSYTIRSESRYGSGTTSFRTDEVLFEYEVNGTNYRSSTISPNGGELPPVVRLSVASPDGEQTTSTSTYPERRAYYKPNEPGIAVLDPTPYHGNASMIVFGGLSTIIVAVHLLSELIPRLKGMRKSSMGKS